MSDREPDFHGALHAGGLVLYRRVDHPGSWLVVPHALDVATRIDGTPDFQLDLVRSASGSADVKGYGVVDLRVAPVVDLDAARGRVDGAAVEPARFANGWLRLLVRDPDRDQPSTLLPPVEVASNGLGVVRLSAQLSADGVSLLKRALLEGAVLVEAWAEMQIRGVSPRFPVVVSLRAADLMAALGRDALADRLVTRGQVIEALLKTGVMSGVPDDLDRAEVAEAVADRLRNLTASPVPSPRRDFAEWWHLEIGESAAFSWNLRDTVEATRMTVLRFDPVGLVRKAMSAGGLDRLVVHRELQDFRTGFVPVTVTANLLERRTPVLSCGVDLVAPPRPPHRTAAIRETVELAPPDDRGDVVLRFAADEPPAYQYETFLIVQTGTGIREWRSPAVEHSGGTLRLGPNDFAGRFVAVTATPQLLAAGLVSVLARWEDGDERVALSGDQPSDALVIASSARDARISCRLEREGRAIEAAATPARDLDLDLPLFREYGAHSVEIEVDFSGGPDFAAIDLKPEDAPDSAATTLAFSSTTPKRTWTWFAGSPFAPGYAYRAFRSSAPLEPWSAAQSPFEALTLRSRDLATDRVGPGGA